MSQEPLVECSFLIPLRRDAEISDGELHETPTWNWLEDELYELFGALQIAPGLYQGAWKSPKTGQRVSDQSRKYIIAVLPDQTAALRGLIEQACTKFDQQCLYLSIAGKVELVEAPHHEQNTEIPRPEGA